MLSGILHANTKALLLAWQRMIKNGHLEYAGPSVDEYPGLLGGLFIIERTRADIAPFRIAGDTLPALFGRDLVGTNFLDLWTPSDRQLAAALLSSVTHDKRPGVIRLYGKSHQDRRLDVEISIAPLEPGTHGSERFLCLYQTLGGEAMLHDQAIVSHKIKSIYVPEEESKSVRQKPHLRLVSQS